MPAQEASPMEPVPDLPTTEAPAPKPPPPPPTHDPPPGEQRKPPPPEPAAEEPIYTPRPDPPPPPAPTMADDVDTAVQRIRPKVAELTDDEVHPEIMLPMILIRDKLAMVKYADALGRNPQEAQSRREHLRIPPGIMACYLKYKAWCENHGKSYWTERGFAAAVICYQRGVPIREAAEDAPQDILDDLDKRMRS